MFTVGIIISSDKGSKGEREDLSGKIIKNMMQENGYEVVDYIIIPDEKLLLQETMIEMCDKKKIDLILTSGGTGFSKRDVTPEATLEIINRQTPGISEAIRYYSLQITPKAMLSRAASGIRGDTLIINLPGSPKAVKESIEFLLPALEHGLEILKGIASECGKE